MFALFVTALNGGGDYVVWFGVVSSLVIIDEERIYNFFLYTHYAAMKFRACMIPTQNPTQLNHFLYPSKNIFCPLGQQVL